MAIIYNGSTVSWHFILYVVICISIGITAIRYQYMNNQIVAAGLTFILLLLVFIFYGLRWFQGFNLKGLSSANSSSASASCSWPPIVNLCPDYMVTWTHPNGNIYCYDASNIYNLKAAQANPAYAIVSGLTINSVNNQSGYHIYNPVGSATDAANPRYPLINAMASANGTLTDPSAANLRWEGVWDGQTLNLGCIPTADGAKPNVPGVEPSTCA